jgi:glucokinase
VSPDGTAILGDLGATYARLALLHRGKIGPITTVNVEDYSTPVDAIRAFLESASADRPTHATIAAAGPVVNDRIVMTNAPWVVDAGTITAAFGLSSTVILNDFAALAWALPALTVADVQQVGRGTAAAGAPLAVLGPGSGFGVAGLVRGQKEEIAVVTEGGHATLPADNEREEAIIRALREKFGHVSIERALSGSYLGALCTAVAAVDGLLDPGGDAPEIVSRALQRSCPASLATLELFCALLGSVAGNIALTLGAQGGVFIAGGLVPRFLDFFQRSTFRERFEGKGRLTEYLARVPTCVITHPHPAFLGLARLAARSRG